MALFGLNRENLMECWKKVLENITKSDSNSALTFVDHHLSPDMNFNGHCLIKSNISICKSIHFLHRFFLSNCLFGSVKLTKTADIDKYKYSG